MRWVRYIGAATRARPTNWRRAIGNACSLPRKKNLKSVAFPAISTGVYGYPIDEAAGIAVHEIRSFLERPGSVEEVRVVLFGGEAFKAFERALAD